MSNVHLLQNCTALTIGVTSTKYIVNESDGDVTITVGVRGGANRCNKSEWTVNYIIRSISAQCEHLHKPMQL